MRDLHKFGHYLDDRLERLPIKQSGSLFQTPLGGFFLNSLAHHVMFQNFDKKLVNVVSLLLSIFHAYFLLKLTAQIIWVTNCYIPMCDVLS